MSRGYFKSALRNFCQAIKKDATQEESFVQRANCYLSLNKPDKALEDANEAFRLQQERLLEWPNHLST